MLRLPYCSSHALAIAIHAVIASNAFSQTSTPNDNNNGNSKMMLEEVLVTAQRRTEAIQEVPISVAAVNDVKIAQAGVENIEDLTALLPNIHFTESGFSTQVRVRGVGSDNSQGFEQSVGMYVDGTYYGRAQLFRAPMMDMQRIEVLRGPQSTLFGKNSIAGALNLTTKRPTDSFEASVSASHEFEFNTQELNAVISGLITDTLKARLAVRGYQDDGYVFNSHLNTQEPQSDESAIRASAEWQATDNLDIYVKVERNNFDTRGRSIETTLDTAIFSSPNDVLPGFRFFGDANYSTLLNVNSLPGFEPNLDFTRQTDVRETSDNTINNQTVIAQYAWGDYDIIASTSALDYTYSEVCDCDFTPAEILELHLQEDYAQVSQEIRIASPQGDAIEWLAGAFYQNYEQTFEDQIFIRNTNDLPLLNPALTPVLNTANRRLFEQNSEVWALFGRIKWQISTDFSLIVGGRFSDENKDGKKSINLTEIDGLTVLPNSLETATAAAIYNAAFRLETEQFVGGGHNLSEERSDTLFTPLIIGEYHFNDDVLGYASYSKGTKAGGYDPRSNQSSSFGFEDESATSFELGLKSTVANGRGEINVAFYHTRYDDLQFSQFDGAVGFNVGNIKETVVKGVEIDGRYKVNETVTLSYGASYLDFEYTDFTNGNCFAGRAPDTVLVAAVAPNPDVPGDIGSQAFGFCDYTGERGVATPKISFNTSFDIFYPINEHFNFTGFVDFQHVGRHQVHVNLDPRGRISAYNVVSARAGIDATHWSIALLGKNLLNEEIITYSANMPLSDANFSTNSHYSFIKRPRTIALEGTYHF